MSLRLARLLAALILSLALFLPGCFDYDLELVITPEGGGFFSATLQLPEGLASQFKAGPEEILAPEPQLIRKAAGPGVVDLVQAAAFGLLDQLKTQRVRFKLERIDMGLVGIGDDTYRLTGWLRSLEGDRPDRDQPLGTELDDRLPPGAAPRQAEDPAAAQAQELLAASLAGRYVGMTWVVPGKILKAWGINIAGQRVEPTVDAKAGRVQWRVPLALLANAKVRHTLIFRADFKGSVRFKAENVHKVESKWFEEPAPADKAPEGKDKDAKPGSASPAGAKP
ncbi:MAG: hypothetical protein KQH53_01010 [Desulfarculaceae bacterium]|nr:hypothetical protein [Desulfarculaceae bacterium]